MRLPGERKSLTKFTTLRNLKAMLRLKFMLQEATLGSKYRLTFWKCLIFVQTLCSEVNKVVEKGILPAILRSTEIRMCMVEHDSMVHEVAIVAILDIFEYPTAYVDSQG